jgi:DNA-binding response OmpR family regulator
MKILIAEDDPFLSKIYKMTLEGEGHEVLMASDGEDALKICHKDRPDIILLDILMPKKDGFAVLKEVKATEGCKDIPVVILSNLGQEADVQKGLKLGAVDYIVKGNVELEDVAGKIKKYGNA